MGTSWWSPAPPGSWLPVELRSLPAGLRTDQLSLAFTLRTAFALSSVKIRKTESQENSSLYRNLLKLQDNIFMLLILTESLHNSSPPPSPSPLLIKPVVFNSKNIVSRTVYLLLCYFIFFADLGCDDI